MIMAKTSNEMGRKFSVWGLVISCCVVFCVSSDNFDPYSLIGVSRTASIKEIKRSYKNLVRQWHPDKNKEDGAQEKFIQLQRAYEILSDEQKRAEYDQYGHVSTDQQSRPQHRRDPFSHFHFGDGHFQFHFTNHGSSRPDPRSVTLQKFESGILPESQRKPFLLLVTGDWCFSCVRVEGMWNDAVPELESLGIGMGTIHGDYSRALLRKLGVYQWPSIVGVADGRVVIFDKNHVNPEKLKEFVRGLLPGSVITRVTDSNQDAFLFGWHSDNKPRSLLFSRRSSPSLLYQLLAFKLQDLHAFGFAQSSGADTTELVWKYDIALHIPTLLVFKEDTEEYAEKIEASKIDTSLLEDAVTRNRYLFVPRLTSQSVYEALCPESPVVYGRRLCIILITKNPSVHQEHRDIFRQVAKTTDSFPVDVQLAYIYQEKQPDFVKALGRATFDSDGSVPVVILWRLTGRKVKYDWLPDDWHGSDPEEDRKRLVYFLQQIADKKFTLGYKMMLPELKDENAPHWILQWLHHYLGFLWRAVTYTKQLLLTVWSESSMAFLVVAAYLLAFLLAFAGLLSTSKEAMEPRANGNTRSRDGHRRPPPEQDGSSLRLRRIEFEELNESKYERFLASSRPGHILLLLLTDRKSSNLLCQYFDREAHVHVLSQPFLIPAVLMVDTYRHWLSNLYLQSDTPPTSVPSSIGTVLALRPSKNYYYIFTPAHSEHSRRLRDELGLGFIGLQESESDSESEDYIKSVSLDRLGMWLDRLLDGSLAKINVTSWPPLD